MKKPINIAIDGPAGAGKSTIARQLANRLGILYLDTGAMYRAVGLKALRTNTDMRSEPDLERMLNQTVLDIQFGPNGQQVILDGVDVTDAIRSSDVSRAASDVSAIPAVRHRLVEMQRCIAEQRDLVLDGRDIGTYVLPDAPFKFFLTADVKERARRRLNDLQARGETNLSLSDVIDEVSYRDQQDSSRSMAPLKQAEDAILIDTTGLTIEEVIGRVLAQLRPQQL
ncbi:MAG: (d)CMP kinase [Clostridiaceae bacterium]|jgi:cytidylate kinase|nr:(d)CMP kinase [Clostridiaceae bacterium]